MPAHNSRRHARMRFTALLAALVMALPSQQPLAAEQPDAGKTARKATQFVKLHGSSPWVCTPSGFGQKARCYRRSA